MNEAFRLSRIRAPRGTAASLVLLAVVFIVFGLVVSTASADLASAPPRYFDDSGLNFASWLIGRWGD